jgi:hypothetical protein
MPASISVQFGGSAFAVASAPLVSMLMRGNAQPWADWLFAAVPRGTAAPDALEATRDDHDGLLWGGAAWHPDWLSAPSPSSALAAPAETVIGTPVPQAAYDRAVSERDAVYKVFAALEDNWDDFGDF